MIKDTYEKNKKEIDIVSVGLVTKTKIQEEQKCWWINTNIIATN